MNNVALRRVSVDGTTYKIGDTISDAHAKKIQKELGKGYIGTGTEEAKAPVDTPPASPAPETPNAPAPEVQAVVNDTPPAPVDTSNDPDADVEDEDKKEIGDVDTPPAPEAPTEDVVLSPEAQELLKKKMGEIADTAKSLGLSLIVGEKKEALVARIIKAQGGQK